MNNIKEVLQNLGLEEREIKIYLILIAKTSLTAMQISKETRIDRTTIYDILERLIDKGIVSSTIKNKTKHFNTLSPKKLLIYFKEKYSSLENILPQLNRLTKQTQEPISCELFQGKEGLKTLIRDFVETKADYKAIGIRKEYEETLGYLTDQSVLKFNESNIKETAIVERGVEFIPLKNGVYRYIDKKFLPPITTLIYNQVVIFFIWKEPYFAIRIENKDFAKLQEEYFEMLWKQSKK